MRLVGGAELDRGRVAQEVAVLADRSDVTGAGDTVLAACALALGAGGTLEEATVLANHAAGVVVGKLGTATLNGDELRAAIKGGRPAPRGAELRAAGAARVLVRGHRKRTARAAREHWTGPRRRRRPSAKALMLADGVRGHRKRGARAAREHWTGPRGS